MRATNFWLHALLITSLTFVAACGGGGGSDNEAENPTPITSPKKEITFKTDTIEPIAKTALDMRDFVYHVMATRIFGFWAQGGGAAVCINRSTDGSAQLDGTIAADGQTSGTVTLRFSNCKMQYFVDDESFFIKNPVLPIVTLNGNIPITITKSSNTGTTKYFIDLDFNEFSWSADDSLVPPLFYCDSEKNAFLDEHSIERDEVFEVATPPEPSNDRKDFDTLVAQYNQRREEGTADTLIDEWDADPTMTDIGRGATPAKLDFLEQARSKVSRHYREKYSIGGEMRVTYAGNIFGSTGKMTATTTGDLSFRHISGDTVNFVDMNLSADITDDANALNGQRYKRTGGLGTISFESQQEMRYSASSVGPITLEGGNGFIEISSTRLVIFHDIMNADGTAIEIEDGGLPTFSEDFYIQLATNAFGDIRFIRVPEDDLGNVVPADAPSVCEPTLSFTYKGLSTVNDYKVFYEDDGTIKENPDGTIKTPDGVSSARLLQQGFISTNGLNTNDPDHDYFKYTWSAKTLPANNLKNDNRENDGDYLFKPADENDTAAMSFSSYTPGNFTLEVKLENPEADAGNTLVDSLDLDITVLLDPAKFDVSGSSYVQSNSTYNYTITPAADAQGDISFELVGAPEGAQMHVQNNNYSIQWDVGELPFGEASIASLSVKSFNGDSERVQTFPIQVEDSSGNDRTPAMQNSFYFALDFAGGVSRSFSTVSDVNNDSVNDWLIGSGRENFFAVNYDTNKAPRIFSAWGNLYSENISITPVENWKEDLSNQTASLKNYDQIKVVKKATFYGFDYLVALTRVEVLLLNPANYDIVAIWPLPGKIADAWHRFDVVDFDGDGTDSIIYLPTDDDWFEVIEYTPNSGNEYTEAGQFLNIFRSTGPNIDYSGFIVANVSGDSAKEIITNTGLVYDGASFARKSDIESDIAPNIWYQPDCDPAGTNKEECIRLTNFRNAYGMLAINTAKDDKKEILSLQPDGLHIYGDPDAQGKFTQIASFGNVTFSDTALPQVYAAIEMGSSSNTRTSRLFVGSNGVIRAFTIVYDGAAYDVSEETAADSGSGSPIINLALGNIDNDVSDSIDIGYVTLQDTASGDLYPEFNVLPDIKNWDAAVAAMWNSGSSSLPFSALSKVNDSVADASYCEAPVVAAFNASSQKWEVSSNVMEVNADGSSTSVYAYDPLPPASSQFAVGEIYSPAEPMLLSAENFGSNVQYKYVEFNGGVELPNSPATPIAGQNRELFSTDYDGDGFQDVLRFVSNGVSLDLLIDSDTSIGTGLGTYQTLATASYLPQGADYATIYRLTADALYRYTSDALGEYSTTKTYTLLTGTYGSSLLVADLDGDDVEEVFVGLNSKEIAVLNFIDTQWQELRTLSLDPQEGLTAMALQDIDDDHDGNVDRHLLILGVYQNYGGAGRRCYVKAIDAEGGGLAWKSPTLNGSSVVDIQWVGDRLHVITNAAVYVSQPQN